MAYFDHAAANRQKAISEKYDELKKHIHLENPIKLYTFVLTKK